MVISFFFIFIKQNTTRTSMVRVLLFSVFPLVYFGTYFLFIYQYLIKRYNLLYAMEKIRFSRSRRNFETSSFSLALVPLHSQIKYILFLLFKSNSFVCALSFTSQLLSKGMLLYININNLYYFNLVRQGYISVSK